jgi:flagellar hook-basal body complex protein FliE
MMLKQNFADQLQAQSEIWKAQVKDYQGKVEQAGEQARGEYKKSMEQMQDKAEEARNLAEKVRGANEEAWKDMVGASQKAFVELQGAGPTQFRVSSETYRPTSIWPKSM